MTLPGLYRDAPPSRMYCRATGDCVAPATAWDEAPPPAAAANTLFSAPHQSTLRDTISLLMRSERGYLRCEACGAPGAFLPTWRSGAPHTNRHVTARLDARERNAVRG